MMGCMVVGKNHQGRATHTTPFGCQNSPEYYRFSCGLPHVCERGEDGDTHKGVSLLVTGGAVAGEQAGGARSDCCGNFLCLVRSWQGWHELGAP
jgi:hypothetical protein